jgi:plasmid segregation protein ParM
MVDSAACQQESPLIVGLDVGFGVTKAVVSNHAPVIFPSVCGKARPLHFRAEELMAKYPGDQITDEEGIWYVGQLAQTQLTRPGDLIRLRGRTADEAAMGNVFRARMAKVALGKLLPHVRSGDVVYVQISTGLPVEHMADSDALKQALLGRHAIRTDQADFIADVTEVIVMPQPFGTLYAHTLTEFGEINDYYTFHRTGVCDVGTYTVDLVLDDEGDYVEAESGSIEAGVYTAYDLLQQFLEGIYRQPIPLAVVEEVLRTGEFHAHGKPVDYRLKVEEVLEPLRAATLSLLNAKWKAGTLVDVIYLSGGGARLVEKVIKAVYPQARVVLNPQVANAQGYLNYALFRAKTPAGGDI